MGVYEDNRIIKSTVKRLNEMNDERYTFMLANVLMHRMYENGEVPSPMDGDSLWIYEDSKGRRWYPLFTDETECSSSELPNVVSNISIKKILTKGLSDESVKGIIINPFGNSRKLVKETIGMIFEVYKKEFSKDE